MLGGAKRSYRAVIIFRSAAELSRGNPSAPWSHMQTPCPLGRDAQGRSALTPDPWGGMSPCHQLAAHQAKGRSGKACAQCVEVGTLGRQEHPDGPTTTRVVRPLRGAGQAPRTAMTLRGSGPVSQRLDFETPNSSHCRFSLPSWGTGLLWLSDLATS